MKSTVFASLLFLLFTSGCTKSKDTIDQEYPVIDISIEGAFPVQCTEIIKGEKFVFRAHFSDNAELGTYSLDIHNNFDGHNHSTEVEECGEHEHKTPVNPFVFIQTYTIPSGKKNFEAVQEISVPADVDAGNYHFTIRLTDKQGWQTVKGVSIRVLEL